MPVEEEILASFINLVMLSQSVVIESIAWEEKVRESGRTEDILVKDNEKASYRYFQCSSRGIK